MRPPIPKQHSVTVYENGGGSHHPGARIQPVDIRRSIPKRVTSRTCGSRISQRPGRYVSRHERKVANLPTLELINRIKIRQGSATITIPLQAEGLDRQVHYRHTRYLVPVCSSCSRRVHRGHSQSFAIGPPRGPELSPALGGDPYPGDRLGG